MLCVSRDDELDTKRSPRIRITSVITSVITRFSASRIRLSLNVSIKKHARLVEREFRINIQVVINIEKYMYIAQYGIHYSPLLQTIQGNTMHQTCFTRSYENSISCYLPRITLMSVNQRISKLLVCHI